VEVTTRTFQSRLLLTPKPLLNRIILGVLARAGFPIRVEPNSENLILFSGSTTKGFRSYLLHPSPLPRLRLAQGTYSGGTYSGGTGTRVNALTFPD